MLRQHPERRIATIPVIMLTALASQQDKLHGLELGADAYLPKPYSQQEVLLLGAKLIERHRREMELEKKFLKLHQDAEGQNHLHSLLFHELRNQLTILQTNADLLQHADGIAGESRRVAIQRSSNYLHCLAEDFLLILEVQGNGRKLPGEPLLAQDVATEMVALYASTARARQTELTLRIEGAPRPLTTNRPALKIILSALIDNAIKYGPAGDAVIVTCRFDRDWLEMSVHDEGKSLPPEEREHLFERFYRGSASQLTAGSGLGLFGVRILANALGGDAELEDQQGHGNSFRVRLPISHPC